MKVRDRIFEQYKEYEFTIPLNDSVNVFVKEGEGISFGDKLFVRGENSVKESIYLPKEIGCSPEKSKDFLSSLSGEFVQRGDIIAEKTSRNGLTVKRVEVAHSGIVSTKRILDGYVDILGEQSDVEVKSNFTGKVISSDPIRGLRILAETTAMDLRAVSKDFFNAKRSNESISGEFVLLGDGTSVYTLNDLEEDYKGKIVFAGRFVYEDVLKKLFELGAVCVIAYAMDYKLFRSTNLPVGVIGGFGNINFPDDIRKGIADMSRCFVVADGEEKQMFFVKRGNMPLRFSEDQEDDFVDVYIGEKVISYDPQSYGRIGTVIQYDQESEYLTVEFQKGINSVISLGAVDFVSL
jgi:hypothetical protein